VHVLVMLESQHPTENRPEQSVPSELSEHSVLPFSSSPLLRTGNVRYRILAAWPYSTMSIGGESSI
jgi:hypothetical protein